MNIILRINNEKLENLVVLGTYAVNKVETYDEWIDGNFKKHKVNIRSKISGTFDLMLKKPIDYGRFVNAINDGRNPDGSVPVLCSVNNTNGAAVITANITFAPKRNKGADGEDFFEQFTVTLEEL